MSDHTSALYGFCGAFFSELRGAGIKHVVVSPGARSTPLVVSADRAGLETWVHIDERSGAFFALGMAKRLRSPVALICTSGTAAANYLPAVLEADRSDTPLIVLTADRPPELRRWGSNQTVDQVGLYGTAVRWFAELPVASESDADVARRFAARAAAVAAGPPAGPAHLNFPLRPPLAPDDAGSSSRPSTPVRIQASLGVDAPTVAAFREVLEAHPRGVILAGAMTPGSIDVDAVLRVAADAGWPILAEPTSQLRVAAAGSDATVVSTASYLVQHAGFAAGNIPDAVVLLGAAPPQRSLQRWLRSIDDARVVLVGDGAEWRDESFTHTDVFRCSPKGLFGAVGPDGLAADPDPAWAEAWRAGDEAAAAAINGRLIESDLFEGRMVTALAGVLPDDAALYVGNSMAVRDVNLYWPRRDRPLDIFSNRGASGIDGMVSSALGARAASIGPVVLMLGDLSLLHDFGGLLAAVRLGLPLVIVVSNNDGGGIFSFLPFAEHRDEFRFHDLFHTPHGVDLGEVVTGVGAGHCLVATSTELQSAVIEALDADGPVVIEARIDADESVKAHRAVDAAVREAISAVL